MAHEDEFFCLWSQVWRPSPCFHHRCAQANYQPAVEGMTENPVPIAQGEGAPVERPPRFRRIRYTLKRGRGA